MHRTHDRVETGAGGGGASKKTKRVSARGCTAAEHGTKSKPFLAPDGAFATLFRHLLVPERERVPLQRLGDVRSNGVSRLRRQRLVIARDSNGFRPRDRGEQLRDRLAVVTPAGFSRGEESSRVSSRQRSFLFARAVARGFGKETYRTASARTCEMSISRTFRQPFLWSCRIKKKGGLARQLPGPVEGQQQGKGEPVSPGVAEARTACGIELVTISFSISLSLSTCIALPLKIPCVTSARTVLAPFARRCFAASARVPHVSAMSSIRIAVLPSTLPTRTMRAISLAFLRSLWNRAKSRSSEAAIDEALWWE